MIVWSSTLGVQVWTPLFAPTVQYLTTIIGLSTINVNF